MYIVTCLSQDPRPPPSTGSQLSHSALELQSSGEATVMVGRERERGRDSSEEERRAVQDFCNTVSPPQAGVGGATH